MQIIRGKQKTALKVVVYGPEGIGKSTFAAQFPNRCSSTPRAAPSTWTSPARLSRPAGSCCSVWSKSCIADPRLCGTLIIDTMDWAELLCSRYVCDKAQKKSIEEFGYGKGYTYLMEEFGSLLNTLNELVERGVNVVVTAHAKMRKFEQPDELGAYDRWEMKLSAKTAPLVKEWADMVLFANYKTFAVKTENGKTKGQGGERRMYTTHHPCWDAKNRFACRARCRSTMPESPISSGTKKIFGQLLNRMNRLWSIFRTKRRISVRTFPMHPHRRQ